MGIAVEFKNGQVSPSTFSALCHKWIDEGVTFPHLHAVFEADLLRREKLDEEGAPTNTPQELVEQFLKPDWVPTYFTDDLHDVLFTACKSEYLEGKLGTAREEISNALADIDSFEFTKLDISEIDQLKASGVRKKWIAREILKITERDIAFRAHEPSYISEPYWFFLLKKFKMDGYKYTLRCRVNSVDRAKIVKSAQVIKPAKILKCAFPKADDSAISAAAGFVADELRLRCDSLLEEYDIETSDYIADVYMKIHVSQGSLGESCMRAMDRETFEIYDDYMPNTRIAFCTNHWGELIGRALLHTDVYNYDNEESYNIMDRIYSTDSRVLAAFKLWAKKHKYYRKLEQRIGEDQYVSPDGRVVEMPRLGVQCVVINKGEFEQIPYVDTFSHYSEQDPEYLWSDEVPEIDNQGTWHLLKDAEGYDTSGFFTKRRSNRQCRNCSADLTYEDDIHHGPNYENAYGEVEDEDDIYCERCFNNAYATCGKCGRIVDRDEVTFIDADDMDVCDDCYKEHYRECELCGCHIPKHEALDFLDEYGEESYICEPCSVKSDKVAICQHCDGFTHIEDMDTVHTVNYRKEQWCSDCRSGDTTRCYCCGDCYEDGRIRKGVGYRSKYNYCTDCWDDEFEEYGVPEFRCKCSCDERMCLQGCGDWKDCHKRLIEGEISIIEASETPICKCCGQPIYRMGEDFCRVDELGNIYHFLCYLKHRRTEIHPCKMCSKYQQDVFTMLGESMCDHCILKTKEGEERFIQGLKISAKEVL